MSKKIRLRVISILSIAILCILYYVSNHIYFNPSKSEQQGYYWVYEQAKYKRGDIVMVCVRDKMSINILHKLGLPHKQEAGCHEPYLLKQIVGLNGDVIIVSDGGIKVDGILYPNTKGIKQYKNIVLNPLAIGRRYKLRRDDYFLLGQDANSYDSRYFGIVKKHDIHYKASLLLARSRLLW